jgi:hypothetical protein
VKPVDWIPGNSECLLYLPSTYAGVRQYRRWRETKLLAQRRFHPHTHSLGDEFAEVRSEARRAGFFMDDIRFEVEPTAAGLYYRVTIVIPPTWLVRAGRDIGHVVWISTIAFEERASVQRINAVLLQAGSPGAALFIKAYPGLRAVAGTFKTFDTAMNAAWCAAKFVGNVYDIDGPVGDVEVIVEGERWNQRFAARVMEAMETRDTAWALQHS